MLRNPGLEANLSQPRDGFGIVARPPRHGGRSPLIARGPVIAVGARAFLPAIRLPGVLVSG